MRKIHRITRGDNFSILIPLQVNGVMPWPVEGWKFWFTVKAADTDADADAIFQLSTDDGTILAHGSSTVRCEGAPEHTKTKPLGTYKACDFQAKSPSGRIETLERCTVIIEAEPTQAD